MIRVWEELESRREKGITESDLIQRIMRMETSLNKGRDILFGLARHDNLAFGILAFYVCCRDIDM